MLRKSLRRVILGWLMLMIMAALLGDISLAATDVGRTSADFLQIGQGARAAGMGGAYTAVSEGAIAAYWNPAGLSNLEGSEISLGHFAWYQDITVEQGSFAFPVADRAVLAASITYVNYGAIEGYDVSGASTGELTAYDWVGGLSLGYSFNDALSGGITGKFINQKLDTYSASTFAGDFGLKYDFPKFALALAVTNVGGKLTFDQESENLPSALKFGLAVRPLDQALVTSLELEKRFYGDFLIRQGIELGFGGQYYLRTGYDYLPAQDGRALATGMSVGAGVRFDVVELNYAYTPNDKATAEDLHRFSVVFRPGR